MHKLLLFSTFLLINFSIVFAQNNQGARLTAMGNTGAAVKDIWSINANPAGISELKSSTTALNYTRYLYTNELSEQNFALILPFQHNFAGLSLNRYGINEYNELKIGFAFAKQFGDELSIGLKANYHQLKITNYGSTATFSVDVGATYLINKELSLGLYLNNPSSQQFNATNLQAKIPSEIHLGAAYEPSNKVIIAGEIIKDFNRKVDVAFGIDYKVMEVLSLRGGMNAKPFKQSAGIGLHLKHLNLDMAVQNHPQIGYTPQIGFSYAL